ncbi:MAG TPA: ROK family protein [Acidimicrobiales bacterium]|nr:ROK family protein [Acidimicrobiales bacterium]
MTATGTAEPAVPCLALDIGATKVDAALVGADGTISSRRRLLVADAGDDLFAGVSDLVAPLAREGSPGVVGVACAGPMSGDREEVSPLNIAQWRRFPLRARLREALGVEVHVEGDARALALAEGRFGAAGNLTSYLSMVVSTGIGGGLVLDGRLVNGASANAGHVGHLHVVDGGRNCACGAQGCLEAEASGSAIAARTGRPARDADPDTRRRSAELVGRAVGTLGAVLDFTHCFVAGSVARGYGAAFFATATASARQVARLEYCANVEVRPSALDDDGPLLGAALVGWRGSS